MKSLFLVLVATLGYAQCVTATTYYFSSRTGNDERNGKSRSTPWRSLSKITETNLAQGDSILLERGSTFNEPLLIRQSYTYAGAYGSGSAPVITGAVTLTGWTSAGKNLWKTTCGNCTAQPGNLFVDGKFQPLGRSPNTGYHTATRSERSKTSLTDTSLHVADGYWKTAEIVVRSSRWTLDNLRIKDHHNKTFVFSAPASYEIQDRFGYFIQNHISTLDSSGEWFFDAGTKEIFLYLHPGTHPSDHALEVSIHEHGLILKNTENVVIENLNFIRHRTGGVYLENCRGLRLNNVSIFDSGKNGLDVISCHDIQVSHAVIAGSNNNGVNWKDSDGVFSNNTILRTGLHAGRGVSGNGTYIAVAITSQTGRRNIFEGNTIDSTGYSAIDFRSGNTIIRNNVISNFCMVKDDGGAIYTWHNVYGGNTIDGNTIRRGAGAPKGTVNPSEVSASGVYIDDQSRDLVISNNTISFCSLAGIFLHNAKKITVTGNKVFSNGSFSNKEKGQLYIRLDTLGEMHGNTALDLEVSYNTWSVDHETSYGVFLSAKKKQDLKKLGNFVQNQFQVTHARQAVAEMYAEPGLCFAPYEFSLQDWSRLSGYENKSVASLLQPNKKKLPAGKNLIPNGDLTLGSQGWIAWPDPSARNLEESAGPSLRITVASPNSEALLYHAGFGLRKDKLYRLSFTARSLVPAKLEFVPLMAVSPWHALAAYTCFSLDTEPKTFTCFFKPDKNGADARVNFKSNSTFWISDVSLREVTDTKF